MTLLTNVGVLAGLFVLIYEVNVNTQAVENESDVAIYNMAAENSRLLIENRALQDVYLGIGTTSWRNLSESDRLILSTYWFNEVDRLELQFRLYTRNRDRLENIVFGEDDLRLPAFRSWWADAKVLYQSDFIAYFDDLILVANKAASSSER